MTRFLLLAAGAALTLAACGPTITTSNTALGPDGQPMQVYNLAGASESRVSYRMLDAVNSLRQSNGASPLELNSQLRAAAATHSRDMSVQNRPWHFGSDGSSPVERVQRAGYPGQLVGEAISETFETELETLSAWMDDPATRDVILNPEAREMGFAWYQEPNGKIWWTLVTGAPGGGGGTEIAGL
ncbi:Cysteine-rich secretory protein family protein [Roseivivax jejudonensis]|uniref:Cysteine-rich secretory protein family protein n=1 Tax=Roseivivax jejudonensis TaxID=1529041 RepID=A0A1X6ZPF6_9RHOB|nr:CAP domain-containing protein [Roseivivax jejudonensis]SLN57701.1 Cysteine-rich secretory protein family protein [Roseivivax jejudonensis]